MGGIGVEQIGLDGVGLNWVELDCIGATGPSTGCSLVA